MGALRATGGFVFGIAIVAIGTLMLLSNLGVLRARTFWDYAPLILVLLGAARIFEAGHRPAGTLFGGLLMAGGSLWFLSNIGVLYVDPRLVWPVLLIGLGVLFLFRAVERQFEPMHKADATGFNRAEINVATMFGGVKRNVDSPDFRSADLFACFGGVEVSFRGSKIASEAVIDANAIFGGVEIQVPHGWLVEVRGTGLFGGFDDKTLRPDPSVLNPPRLVVTGMAIFGGVGIRTV
jgi:hypothetical protein